MSIIPENLKVSTVSPRKKQPIAKTKINQSEIKGYAKLTWTFFKATTHNNKAITCIPIPQTINGLKIIDFSVSIWNHEKRTFADQSLSIICELLENKILVRITSRSLFMLIFQEGYIFIELPGKGSSAQIYFPSIL